MNTAIDLETMILISCSLAMGTHTHLGGSAARVQAQNIDGTGM
jgi:hypothetical protein